MFGFSKKASRLVQWQHERRSVACFAQFCQRQTLIRAAVVFSTILLLTLTAFFWGPPVPYRVGEVYPYDLRVREPFQLVNHIEWVNQQEKNEKAAKTGDEKAKYTERPVIEKYPQDMVLVARGQPIGERQLALLKAEHQAYHESCGFGVQLRRCLALFLIFSLLAIVIVLYVLRFQACLAKRLPTIIGVCLLVVVTLTFGLLLSRPPWYAALIPLTLTAMILTLAYNPQFALLMSLSLSLAMTVMMGTDLGYLLVQMGGLSAVVLLLRHVRTRTQLVKTATLAGLAFCTMTIATELLSGQTWNLIFADSFRHFLWGTAAGFVLTGLLPVVERIFGIVTDISLLELADGSHPLLQELVRRAPGTYTHSMTVATLAESAAEAIGANALLTRIGSYFHDIGKMMKPHYFIENQTGENRHDMLEPALSTLVIIGHVKDGLALAQQYKLPAPIQDFIVQHHGTTLIEYFYREAMRLKESNGIDSDPVENAFRYPGPKPQNRENGILLLADAVESTSRTLSEPTPNSLQKLVHDLLMKRLLDGQFEESGLTLTELHRIEESLCKSLTALFHSRIKYPDQQDDAKAA